MKSFGLALCAFFYRHFVKRILFLVDAETTHHGAVSLGSWLGRRKIIKRGVAAILDYRHPALRQSLFGLHFENPLGLAAGFDYEARLTQFLPALGFGFSTVGTLTKQAYEGNPRPRLGRLPRSRSLLVNKGFKNLGVEPTLARLRSEQFAFPVGVSIGKTNTAHQSLVEAVQDVVAGFRAAEVSGAPFAYYELNISCPNLKSSVEFYPPNNLHALLDELQKLRLSRPIWLKLPISKTDEEILALVEVFSNYPFAQAVILGNLERNRSNPTFVQAEVGRCAAGNFSGAPCRARSDELVRLVYRRYGSQLRVIGCGGVFSAEDAYRKIRNGASLVQLITGLIFEGPQLVSQINRKLPQLLARDGLASIHEAVGVDA